jgi:chemotaxis signal transduction protein
VLVAESGDRRAGFEIDEVDAVRVLAEPDAEAESPLLTGVRLDGGQLIGFLDIPRVFDELHRSAP